LGTGGQYLANLDRLKIAAANNWRKKILLGTGGQYLANLDRLKIAAANNWRKGIAGGRRSTAVRQ